MNTELHVAESTVPDGLLDWCLRLHELDPGIRRTNRGDAYHSSNDMLARDFPGRAWLLSAMALSFERLRELLLFPTEQGHMWGWVNVLRDGGSMSQHSHAPSDMSGCIHLTGGSAFELAIGEKSKARIEPFSGQILCFPSARSHCVARHSGDTPRVSMAFNVYFDEKLGTDSMGSGNVTLSDWR